MDQSGLNQAIYQALDAILDPGVTIIYADQNEPRPARPYLTYKFMTGPTREGHDSQVMTDTGLEFRGSRLLTLSVNFYGHNALEGLATVQSRLQWDTVRAILRAKSLVYISDSGIRDLSQMLETQTETRAQMDVNMRFTDRDTDQGVGTIGTVEIEGHLGNRVIEITESDSEPEQE